MSDTAGAYARWAAREAHGVSDRYEEWALGVASDPGFVALVDELPEAKRQPNLVFAAARFLGAPNAGWGEFREWAAAQWQLVRAVALERSTQTNEAGRCATLLPVLAEITGAVALLEVGASAGLCLYPDRYSYRYLTQNGEVALDPEPGPSEVVLHCELVGCPPPAALPEIVWRGGLDLNPIDPSSADGLQWLETLVWPEHDGRRATLRATARIAADEPAHIVTGDVVDDLPRLAASVPRDATLVVFHSAVLSYVPPPRRAEFAELVARLGATWISNEGLGVLPPIDERLPPGTDATTAFIVSRDGRPRALAGPHGQYYRAIGA